MKTIFSLLILICSLTLIASPPVLVSGTALNPITAQGTGDSTVVVIPRLICKIVLNSYDELDSLITLRVETFRTKPRMYLGQQLFTDLPTALPPYPVPLNGNATLLGINQFVRDYYISLGYNAIIVTR